MQVFDSFKRETLSNIDAGVDYSPKGSIDAPILDLVSLLNSHPNYVTTSTCSGRISLFYQNSSSVENKGVNWLAVKHGIIDKKDVLNALADLSLNESSDSRDSFVFLKAEPLIFHIACRDAESARSLHSLVLQTGYRESGITLGQKKTMLAVRTTAFLFDTIVARGGSLLVSDELLSILIEQCNSRLQSNFERMEHLLRAIKNDWNFPFLTIAKYELSKKDPTLQNLSSRWGHSAITTSSTSSSDASPSKDVAKIRVFGGYGLDSNSSSSKRGLPDLALNCTSQGGLSSFSTSDPSHDLMHACMIDNIKCSSPGFEDIRLLITSGGRKGPQQAAPAIVSVFLSSSSSSSTPVSFREEGDVPPPRWGHSLTAHSLNKSLIMYGGRNETSVFSDVYSMEILLEPIIEANSSSSSDSSSILADKVDLASKFRAIVFWTKLKLACVVDAVHSSLPPSFFHAACEVTINVLGDDKDPQRRKYSIVLLMGGLCSIDQMTENGIIFAVIPEKKVFYPVNCSPQASKSKTSLKEDVLIESSNAISRFGHTLSNINNGKTLLSVGGVSLLNSDFNKLYGNIIVIDYFINYNKLFDSSNSLNSSISSSSSDKFGLLELSFRIPSYNNAIDDANIDCQDCRCHHQTASLSDSSSHAGPANSMLVIGGGAHALGFGAHYCHLASVRIGVSCENALNASSSGRGLGALVGGYSSSKIDASGAKLGGSKNTNERQRYPVVISLKANVKALKTKLEELKIYDKSKRIVDFDLSAGELVEGSGANLPSEAIMAIPVSEGGLEEIARSSESAWLSDRYVALGFYISGSVNSKSSSSSNSNSNSDSSSMRSGKLAIQSNDSLVDALPCENSNRYPVVISLKANVKALKTKLEELKIYDKSKRIVDFDLSAGELVEGSGANLPSEAVMAIPVLEGGLEEIARSSESAWLSDRYVALGYQSTSSNPFSISKSLVHNSYRIAERYLDSVRAKLGISQEGKETYPIKYELVGNVLMIAEESLSGPHWNWLIENGGCYSSSSGSSIGGGGCSNDAIVPAAFWRGLADCFGANRVARRSRIDPGPLRESRVQLIYYPSIETEREEDHPRYKSDVGKNADLKSWVVVTENGIHFGFDLIRVMFCSGNVTERMRMGKVNMCKDEVIVDFYAGIGYYTLPFLFYGNAKFIHACDHNPNSCYSLQQNLNKMKIAASRYKIYLNDNKVTSVELVDLADRICLGLLPSSEDGWPLAARALKSTGGIIHVHENVHEDKIDSWKGYCENKFEKFFLDAGKPMKVTCTWIERVKNYSPRILHIVADLTCSSI